MVTSTMSSCVQLFLVSFWVTTALAQDYQVADINCDFGEETSNLEGGGGGGGGTERLSARLKKPPKFKGHPLFADDRRADPATDDTCQIREDLREPSGLIYNLLVTDLSSCGVVRKDGYAHLRVWFPQLQGVVLATDQEVIIMCQPASPIIIENRAAGFAGALPSAGRVSGVVQESPGRLEYEVALYRHVIAHTGPSHTPVDQAVPIGSRLQLRARINIQATWKYVKLMEVTVSSDPSEPYAPGCVSLVKDGCRVPDFSSIVPHQPRREAEAPGEVWLDFEAFMLDSKSAGSSQLWIHATVKACIDSRDCLPEFCLDLFQPSGHGKRRRRKTTHYAEGFLELSPSHNESLSTLLPGRSSTSHLNHHTTDHDMLILTENTTTSASQPESEKLIDPRKNSDSASGVSTKIGENIGVTVIMPEEFFAQTEAMYESCATFMVLSGFLGTGVLLVAAFLCFITSRLHRTVAQAHASTLDTVIKEHHSKYGLKDLLEPPFQ